MPPVKGQRQARGKVRREEILDIAVEEFARGGANGPVLAAIARRVGLTKQAILHYFGSKDDLLVAVLEERHRRGTGQMLPPDAQDPLEYHVQIARIIESEPGLAKLFTVIAAESIDADAPLHTYFVKIARDFRESLERGLTEAQARGEMRPDFNPAHKAAEIVAFADGAQMHWLLDPERVSLVDLYRSYLTTMLRDLFVSQEGSRPRSTTGGKRT